METSLFRAVYVLIQRCQVGIFHAKKHEFGIFQLCLAWRKLGWHVGIFLVFFTLAWLGGEKIGTFGSILVFFE